jgi:S1-C subfamily serine protease
VDSRGQIVGVNTAIIAFAQGLGFAVPSNTVQWVTTEILQYSRVRRRVLGVTAQVRRMTRLFMREMDLLADQAVEVMDVVAGSPAEKAGLRPGDLIVAINDRLVSSVDDIHRLLSRPADMPAIELTIVRGNQKRLLAIAWPDA